MISTVSPLPLAVERTNADVALLSLPLIASVFYLTYVSLNLGWTPLGFYAHARDVNTGLAYAQAGLWLFSYLLYIVYTIYFVFFYELRLSLVTGSILSLAFFLASALLIELGLSNYFFAASVILQMALIIPVGARLIPATALPSFSGLFLNLLTSSLLTVCITLSAYWDGTGINPRLIVLPFIVSTVAIFLGSFVAYPALIAQASSAGLLTIVIAEENATLGFLRQLSRKTEVAALVALGILLIAGFPFYWKAYLLESTASESALYIYLVLAFIGVAIKARKAYAYAALIPASSLAVAGEVISAEYYPQSFMYLIGVIILVFVFYLIAKKRI